ncbi:MAG: NAD-dependent protein deacylase [Eggerthellaceae bacterium]|nr:NAD-dependent protein deacylase [Eggerthellaceae bacterium]
MQQDQQKLRELIDAHQRIVFFGGAGVSTESGIPDFRSAGGVFDEKWPYPPEVMVSRSYFQKNPEWFYDFYRTKMIFPDAQPNACHRKLAELEAAGKVSAVVTQNIDGLHQMAGSKKVLELHGSVHRNYCVNCGKRYGLEAITKSTGIPRCECGGTIRPDVVLYEEPLDDAVVEAALKEIRSADMIIVAGTSLVVYPAAGFLHYFGGDCLALVNKSETSIDASANFVSRQPIGAMMDW